MLNELIIQGNLTRKPEIRYLTQGQVVVNGAIANNNKIGGENRPCFLEFSIWGKQAEVLANHMNKGSPIILVGQLVQEFWNDRHTGQQRSKHVLKANRFHFCGGNTQQPAQGGTQTMPQTAPATVAPAVVPVTAPQGGVTVATPQTAPVVAPVAQAPSTELTEQQIRAALTNA